MFQPPADANARLCRAVTITAVIELALGIIAGCIATLPPLFKRIGLSLGSSFKRGVSGTDTIPWQRSFAGMETRDQGTENLIMTSPQRLESAQDLHDNRTEGRYSRAHSPSAKRVLSSSNWDIDIEVSGAEDGDSPPPPPPSGKEIQVRTLIRVTTQPFDETASVGIVDFASKPLPLPPPRPKPRDLSITRSRPVTPKIFP
jgi:hypothetical protein